MNIVEEPEATGGVVLSDFPDTAEGRHARWYWDMIHAGAEGITDDEVAEHFGRDFLRRVAGQGCGSAAAALILVASRMPMARSALEEVRTGSKSVSIVYRTPAGSRLEEALQFEVDGDRKIAMRASICPCD